MRKVIREIIFVIIFALLATNSFGQSSMLTRKYVNTMAAANVTQSDLSGTGLPKIAGTWYYIDGKDGNDARNGLTPATALLTLPAAYAKCTTGSGDGIVILSRTISGTTYSLTLTTRLTWAKYGITVVGVASPNVYFGRARITHAVAYDSLASLTYC